jgi:hypothetical protein
MAFQKLLQTSVGKLELSLAAEKKKVSDAEFYIQHPKSYVPAPGVAIDPEDVIVGMTKQVTQGKGNIAAIEGVLAEEQKRLTECNAFIQGDEQLLKMHDPHLVCHFRGEHSWEVDTTFDHGPNRGHWKKRHCTVCPTSETLGR